MEYAQAVWAFIPSFFSGIDIPIMDAGNVAFGSCFAGRHWWVKWRRKTDCHAIDVLIEGLRGVTVFPFLVMLLATVNSNLMTVLLSGNRTVLFLAAVIGLVAVWNSDKWIKERLLSLIPKGPGA